MQVLFPNMMVSCERDDISNLLQGQFKKARHSASVRWHQYPNLKGHIVHFV